MENETITIVDSKTLDEMIARDELRQAEEAIAKSKEAKEKSEETSADKSGE